METALKALLEVSQEENRSRAARDWKKKGGRVLGYLCGYVPEEVIYAAGMLPFRILGTGRPDDHQARLYLTATGCSYCSHALQELLSGELDFLDGLISASSCNDMCHLMDNWQHIHGQGFHHLMYLPLQDRESDQRAYAHSISTLIEALEAHWKIKITAEALRQASALVNESRRLLAQVYALRKRELPPLSGTESLSLTTAAMVMPKEVFNDELRGLLSYLENRQASVPKTRPRLLVSGSLLANPAYLNVIEEAGCLVAMDDLCTGSRFMWTPVDEAARDPILALASRYLSRPCGRMLQQESHLHQILAWVKEFHIDGVLYFPLMFCAPYIGNGPYLVDGLKEAEVPAVAITHDHHLSGVGQLRTRVEAFCEMLLEG